jgi:Xaa-Pro aminopeptidase
MTRIERLRKRLATEKLDGVLITSLENRRYYSGFTGSAGVLLIGAVDVVLVTDSRYWEQAGQEAPAFELEKQGPKLWVSVAETLARLSWRRLGFESPVLSYAEYQIIKPLLTVSELAPLDNLDALRAVKEPGEIKLLAEAARITDIALAKVLQVLKPGVREKEMALEFDYQLRLNGAEGSAFPTIVASGVRSSLPHGQPSTKKIEPGDLVIIDGGALYQGYHGDLTRTVVLGEASAQQKRIYSLVLQAQEAALAFLKAGVSGKSADWAARHVIETSGYGGNFGHGLGHSVGLAIHENPRLSPSEEGKIPEGAAVTVEPGIYLPGWGGVRIEDLVIVKQDGVRNLTGSAKQELVEV